MKFGVLKQNQKNLNLETGNNKYFEFKAIMINKKCDEIQNKKIIEK